MRNSIISLSIFVTAFAMGTARSETRTSPDYALVTETHDAGGGRLASADYAADASIGGVGGVSTASAPPETLKAGYIGQLYDPVGLSISASPTNLNEGTTRQLAAGQAMDDGTFLTIAPASVAWHVVSGPISSISPGGVATGGYVYRDTPASISGALQGFDASLGLTVLNVTTDDCGSYAGDGVDDDWQVGHFGEDNPDAGPDRDPDRDGRDNLFESLCLTVPTDRSSVFEIKPTPKPSEPGKVVFVFGPIRPGRSYTVLCSKDLLPSGWDELTGAAWHDDGDYRIVTDTNIFGPQKFYRVQIGR